jgi:dephospho-CoA kinase
MLKIGLTGGIASGKTTISRLFSERGIHIIDADEVSRSLVEPGKPALHAIAETLGQDLIDIDGTLNRERLRRRVFNAPQERQQLENILHPLIYSAMADAIQTIDGPYCIMAIPLLIETRQKGFVDRILLIDCPVELQKQRLAQRSDMEPSLIDKIIASQATREQRRASADDIIDNIGDFNVLKTEVERLDRLYKGLTSSPP